ncbi:unnamed protein product [Euphydryas editha]|uniref:MARVEL domain-containing protein n=1 Tax=Euphydryas editha TaxID=104508 RepID=A0AAU9TTF6_EUPED|nr:unnamed protein product [Euphydryas editha]
MMFFMAVACLIAIGTMKKQFNSNPVVAATLIFGLVTCSLSIYQIIISLLLVWQSIRTKGSIFICMLWYVSHISLLTMYFLLFSAEAVVCCFKRYIVTGVITGFTGIFYEAAFIYFAIVVNSYLHSLNQERYL